MRKPNARKVHDNAIESEQEQDAAKEEEDVQEVELSVEEDELLEDVAQDDRDGADSEVRIAGEAAFFAGWRAKQKTAEIRKARGFQAASLNPSATSAGSKGPLLEMTGRETTETTLENASAGVLFAGRTGAVTTSVKRRGAITRWTDEKVIRRPREIIQSIALEPAHPDGRWMLETKASPNINDCEFSAQRADGSAWTQPVLYCQINDILEKVHCGSGLCTFQG